jgi:hypothetical protein
MKKFNKYGADHLNPMSKPWGNRVMVKREIRDHLSKVFLQDKNKGLDPMYYYHHQADQVMAMDAFYQMTSQVQAFRQNGVYLRDHIVLTNQGWCGYDKVNLLIYSNDLDQEHISSGFDPLAFGFDYMVGRNDLIYVKLGELNSFERFVSSKNPQYL